MGEAEASMTSKALVIGDVMLDRYLEGQIHRISPEAPVPVVSLDREYTRPGGAGNVAASLAGLGCRVTLAAIAGLDADAEGLRQALADASVGEVVLVGREGLRTISKTRILAGGHQQLMRLDREGSSDGYRRASAELEEQVLPRIADHDVVVLSDYDKGTITEALAQRVIRACREQGVPCLVDPKKDDFRVYAGATLLSPNLLEAGRGLGRALVGDLEIARAAEEARAALGLDYMLITRGADGMTLAAVDGASHFAAEVREVADVTGAGDTVIAVMAACLGESRPAEEACRLASIAAGIAVGHSGCYIVRAAELAGAIRGRSPKIRDLETARRWSAEQRRAGRRVVFTNGCFDILHAGHLAGLEQARRQGDLLVVGLNSDASVRENKGPTRPVQAEAHRASLLAGLACVDAVVVFEDATPEALIREIEPDVLVKGSDYEGKEIAGADFVRSRGGRVVTIPLVPGLSTTGILAASRGDEV